MPYRRTIPSTHITRWNTISYYRCYNIIIIESFSVHLETVQFQKTPRNERPNPYRLVWCSNRKIQCVTIKNQHFITITFSTNWVITCYRLNQNSGAYWNCFQASFKFKRYGKMSTVTVPGRHKSNHLETVTLENTWKIHIV